MKILSSRTIFLFKKVFHTIWVGFLSIFFLILLIVFIEEGGSFKMLPFIVIAILIAVLSYFIMKMIVLDLIDQVYDEGSTLLFVNAKEEVRVNLKDIKNVSYQFSSLPKVTISVRHDTKFGSELSFSPPTGFIPFKKNKDIVELIDRIDVAKGY